MENKSFTYLVENIDRIDVDPNLVHAFKNVMIKMQQYFETNNFINAKDYKTFFETYLLDKKFKIELNDEPRKINAAGFYDHRKNRIVIDSNYIDQPQQLEKILCHEFIHFIVMHDINLNSDNIKNFTNEALTEGLARLIYPGINASYEPQVQMMEFANLLADKVNDYKLFLTGGIDSKITSSNWLNFITHAEKYQLNHYEKGYIIKTAIIDNDYIESQKYLINLYIKPHKINTLDEYIDILNKLAKRPVNDNKFINGLLEKCEDNLIRQITKDEKFIKILKTKLEYLRKQYNLYKDFINEEVYLIEYEGEQFVLDKQHKLHGEWLKGMYTNSNQEKLIIKNTKNSNIKTIIFNDIKYKNPIKKTIENMRKYFQPSTKQDIEIINEALKKDKKILSIERHQLPVVGINQKKQPPIYIVKYEDGIEVSNLTTPLGIIRNINLNEFKGITSENETTSLIWQKPIGSIDGYKVSTLKEKRLQILVKQEIIKELNNSLENEQKNKIVEQYKLNHNLDESDNELEYALYWYSDIYINTLSTEEIKKIEDEILSKTPSILLATIDGKIIIASLFTEQNAFIAEKEVLISNKGLGMYDGLIPMWKTEKNIEKTENLLPLDAFGDLILDVDYTRNITPNKSY